MPLTTKAEQELVGLFALVPAIVDAVRIPVVAAGGIADGRGVAAALTLGASAAVIGTAFLRCPETKVHPAWADALARTTPEQTILSRAFSGRPGRSIATDYVRGAVAANAPAPAPYPVQRGLTAPMRLDVGKEWRRSMHASLGWSVRGAGTRRVCFGCYEACWERGRGTTGKVEKLKSLVVERLRPKVQGPSHPGLHEVADVMARQDTGLEREDENSRFCRFYYGR